jgi:hypothetical protein
MLVGGASQRVRTVTLVSSVVAAVAARAALAQRPPPIDAAPQGLASQDLSAEVFD